MLISWELLELGYEKFPHNTTDKEKIEIERDPSSFGVVRGYRFYY